VVVLAALFRFAGALHTAGQAIAFATTMLALGVAALAAGAAGTYAELRQENEHHQHAAARQRLADIAQVEIERLTGPGEMLQVSLRNGSPRAIRSIYVWADVRGRPGHIAAGIPVGDARVRRMTNLPHAEDLQWQLRSLGPGQQALFAQIAHLDPHPVQALADDDICAFAEFTDVDDGWWRLDEDGNVTRRQSAEPVAAGPVRALPAGPSPADGHPPGNVMSRAARVPGIRHARRRPDSSGPAVRPGAHP
jgi:hypothetical protein